MSKVISSLGMLRRRNRNAQARESRMSLEQLAMMEPRWGRMEVRHFQFQNSVGLPDWSAR